MRKTRKEGPRRAVMLAGGLGAIAVLLAGGALWLQAAPTPGDPDDLDQVAFGERVYASVCAHCHGAKLDGSLGWEEPLKDGSRLAPAHDASGDSWRYSDDKLFEVVKFGGARLGTDPALTRMPAFEGKLSEDEIWAVIAFMKSVWPENLQEAQRNAEE